MTDRRSKIVSFRLSREEYEALRDACAAAGVRSLSELARRALQQVLFSRSRGLSLYDQVCELRNQLSALSREVERVAQRIDQQDKFLAAHAAVGDRI
jgi:hypothetical protein